MQRLDNDEFLKIGHEDNCECTCCAISPSAHLALTVMGADGIVVRSRSDDGCTKGVRYEGQCRRVSNVEARHISKILSILSFHAGMIFPGLVQIE
jgi:hypothetical protein